MYLLYMPVYWTIQKTYVPDSLTTGMFLMTAQMNPNLMNPISQWKVNLEKRNIPRHHRVLWPSRSIEHTILNLILGIKSECVSLV